MDDELQLALRFAQYGTILCLFGLTAFRALNRAPETVVIRRGAKLSRLNAVALVAPLVSAVLTVNSIARMMGQAIGDLDPSMLQSMLLGTTIGLASLTRLILLLIAAFALVFGKSGKSNVVSAWLYAAAIMTLPFEGHAAVSNGILGTAHRLNDALHLLAAGLWMGAIGWFVHWTALAHRYRDPDQTAWTLTALHGFKPMGLILVSVVALTGLLNTILIAGIDRIQSLLSTEYGLLLAAKVILVALMLACAAGNALFSQPAASPSVLDTTGKSLKTLRITLSLECGLAIGVLAIVAALGMNSPMN